MTTSTNTQENDLKMLSGVKPLTIKEIPIRFNKKNHTYKFYKEFFTGVTTICEVRGHVYLKFYAAKKGYEYLQEKWDPKLLYTLEEKEKLLLAAKRAHVVHAEKAAKKGTRAHKWISEYINKQNPKLPRDKEVKNCIARFLECEEHYKPYWLASELVVASLTNKFAGTLDAYALINGKRTIVDFKTSNQLSEDAFLQTAGYQIALEEMGETPEQRMIWRLPKQGSEYEAIVVPTSIEFDKKTFLYLRDVHRWNLYAGGMKSNL